MTLVPAISMSGSSAVVPSRSGLMRGDYRATIPPFHHACGWSADATAPYRPAGLVNHGVSVGQSPVVLAVLSLNAIQHRIHREFGTVLRTGRSDLGEVRLEERSSELGVQSGLIVAPRTAPRPRAWSWQR